MTVAAVTTKNQKVCIIGAGATGLATAKQLAEHQDEFDFVLFERNSDVGGVWIYSDANDVDEHGLPVHSSMYKYLRTNLPKELMAFPDYQDFNDPEDRSCVTHETMLSYLKNYTEHFNLRSHIKFDTLVEKVTPILDKDGDWRSTKYLIKTKNLKSNEISETTYDAVAVCNGHYFDARVPRIMGMETFPGRIIHSHAYRKPEMFQGQTVVVLGASFSGIDIGIEIAEHARTVYLSHNKEKIHGLPDNIIQIAGVISANSTELTLKDNTTVEVDAFVFCTGYRFAYPFLDESSGVKVDDNHVSPLYKQLINVEHPSMSFMGLPLLVVHFPLFYCQAKYYVALLRGKLQLPSKSDMSLDSVAPADRPKRYAHLLGINQWAYNADLAKSAGFEPLPMWYNKAAVTWLNTRAVDVWHYKENNLRVDKNSGNVTVSKAVVAAKA